jgi:hypothetical protein
VIGTATVLAAAEWQPLAAAHAERADALTAGHVTRRRRRQQHPVEDFLFTYYQTRPGRLRVWHPGPGIRLRDAPAYASRRGYRRIGDTVEIDPDEIGRRTESIDWIRKLLTATMSRPAQFGCFGMHEWAMVYRQPAEQVRHNTWPLRLGTDGTDRVVESHRIACSHFDAFRFFTGDARPLNALQPTRDLQPLLEQGGCLHANMDLYKWAAKLMPFTPGSLVLDCLELARDVRELDMRASPYDLSGLGYEPVAVETPTGKATYAAAQRGFADRAGPLRRRLIDLCATLLAA